MPRVVYRIVLMCLMYIASASLFAEELDNYDYLKTREIIIYTDKGGVFLGNPFSKNSNNKANILYNIVMNYKDRKDTRYASNMNPIYRVLLVGTSVKSLSIGERWISNDIYAASVKPDDYDLLINNLNDQYKSLNRKKSIGQIERHIRGLFMQQENFRNFKLIKLTPSPPPSSEVDQSEKSATEIIGNSADHKFTTSASSLNSNYKQIDSTEVITSEVDQSERSHTEIVVNSADDKFTANASSLNSNFEQTGSTEVLKLQQNESGSKAETVEPLSNMNPMTEKSTLVFASLSMLFLVLVYFIGRKKRKFKNTKTAHSI